MVVLLCVLYLHISWPGPRRFYAMLYPLPPLCLRDRFMRQHACRFFSFFSAIEWYYLGRTGADRGGQEGRTGADRGGQEGRTGADANCFRP